LAYLANPEGGYVVGALITNRDELPGGIDGEYSRIIPECRSVADLSQRAIAANREDADGVA